MATVDARLRTYIDRIWQPGGDSPVAVTLGPAPSGHVVLENYAVLPHPRTARFLVPMATRAASVASFRRYAAQRTIVSRSLRRALASGYAAGMLDQLFPHRLVVSVDRRFRADRLDEVLILRHLATQIAIPDLLAFIALRRNNPNAKPVLQLLDPAGTGVGYAKLGTTVATKQLVRTEATAMAAMGGGVESVLVPRLLAVGDWHDSAYTVGSPLPENLHRVKGAEATTEAMREVARSGVVSRRQLAGSTYAQRLRADLAAARGGREEDATVLAAWLERLERQSALLEFGRMHGDWIPSNLAWSGPRLAAWDWEHSSDDAPVGFDFLHWHFHRALVDDGLEAAVREVDRVAPRLALLGVPDTSQPLVASLYLLDAFVTRLKFAVGGGGWNRLWYPTLLGVASTRDVD